MKNNAIGVFPTVLCIKESYLSPNIEFIFLAKNEGRYQGMCGSMCYLLAIKTCVSLGIEVVDH
jgi:hypothetical protein